MSGNRQGTCCFSPQCAHQVLGRGRERSDGVHTRSWGGGERGVMVCTPGPGEGERGE